MFEGISWGTIAPYAAATTAVVAAASSLFSYLLSKRIYDEIKSDEILVAGPLHRVGLQNQDHDNPLLRVTLFNKSPRKSFVTRIRVLDQDNQQIPITWSNAVSEVGSVQNPTGLLGIVDSEDVYMRRNDGAEMQEVTVHIQHSHAPQDLVIKFDPYQGWW